MRPDYIQLLTTVMTKPKAKAVPPTLTYGKWGYSFNGVWFGENEEGAKKARDDYWANNSGIHGEDWPVPQEPMTLDIDLEPLNKFA